MNEIDPNLVVIGSAVLILTLAVVFQLVTMYISRRWRRHQAATVDRWKAEGVEFIRGPAGGQFGGLESMGLNKLISGVGFVVMTDKDLRVTCSTPYTQEWQISYRQIKGVTIQPAFMGRRSRKTPFIVVRFKKEGQADKLAFQVKDFETWATELAQKAKVSLKDTRES
jgi:hypothetical protein